MGLQVFVRAWGFLPHLHLQQDLHVVYRRLGFRVWGGGCVGRGFQVWLPDT